MLFNLLCRSIHKKYGSLQCSLSHASWMRGRSICGAYMTMRMKSSTDDSFHQAKNKLNSLAEEPENDIKLKLYAFFKQATVGQCNIPKPGALDFIGKAKWDAWNELGSMSQDEAKQRYVIIIDELTSKEQEHKSTADSSVHQTDANELQISSENGIITIRMNRPQKMNALTWQMYKDFSLVLKEAANNEAIKVVIVTGTGDYYSSGNDLSNFKVTGNIAEMAKVAAEILKEFVASFIDFPKPLIAAVNGKAIGIPVTLLGLFDIVYASDKATFYTPFSSLGQSPEACSSYTFPKIMGYAHANEILLFNKKLTAEEAKLRGLVTEVFPHDKFQAEVDERIKATANLFKNSLIYSKKLTRDMEREILHKVNIMECDRLIERWQSPDCLQALKDFFQRKVKS